MLSHEELSHEELAAAGARAVGARAVGAAVAAAAATDGVLRQHQDLRLLRSAVGSQTVQAMTAGKGLLAQAQDALPRGPRCRPVL